MKKIYFLLLFQLCLITPIFFIQVKGVQKLENSKNSVSNDEKWKKKLIYLDSAKKEKSPEKSDIMLKKNIIPEGESQNNNRLRSSILSTEPDQKKRLKQILH
ncbi:MAG: hypothetical protein MUW56_15030 [Chryseobacterium sp.]|uniref:hypothetical protein n=1 Tax=Chryseobacterium sp. TaxID=1871047 RepID=UPI0025BAD492|nr:hypothetical protein [Chryseobacterium sp.]MCJ7934890.1 hypothetical protein [Chryseobacterium sp.]